MQKTSNQTFCPDFSPLRLTLIRTALFCQPYAFWVSWEVESKVKEANRTAIIPSGGPPNRLFVSPELRGMMIHWAHTSVISCHPGVRRTLFRIQERFWWPAIRKDVEEYVAACSVCSQNKSSNAPPAGPLQPLPAPQRPWSDISIFVKNIKNKLTTIIRASKK